jgi:hypothetical protein
MHHYLNKTALASAFGFSVKGKASKDKNKPMKRMLQSLTGAYIRAIAF